MPADDRRRQRGWAARTAGQELGYRESTQSWAGVLRGLRAHGLDAPLLGYGDGALGPVDGAPAPLEPPRAQHLGQGPKTAVPDIRRRLREVCSAESRAECELRRDGLVSWLEAHGQLKAADTVRRDWDDFVTFYDFPAEHWM